MARDVTTGTTRVGSRATTRTDRLKAALKANIARRKAQAAARGTASGDRSQEPDDNTPRR